MNFSRWVFRLAGIYGLLVIVPQYFMEQKFGEDFPPAINHVEFYYGFLGLCVAWQIAFLLIAQQPDRYRPLMLVAVIEKVSFAIPAFILFFQHRLPGMLLVAGCIDLIWGMLFLTAWYRMREICR